MTTERNSWDHLVARTSPGLSARTRPNVVPPRFQAMFGDAAARSLEPLVGLSESGVVRPDLFQLGGTGPTAPILEASLEFMCELSADQRQRGGPPVGLT